MINDEKMKVGDEITFHWGDEAPNTVIVITHRDGCEGCAVCVKEPAEMDENRKAFSTCNPVVKADGGREMNDDTISRQAAIDEIVNTPTDVYSHDGIVSVLDGAAFRQNEIIDIINALPSAQPERKRGEWINRSLNILYPELERYTCSACGKHSYNYDFCPHCGSYNGGENHDKG